MMPWSWQRKIGFAEVAELEKNRKAMLKPERPFSLVQEVMNDMSSRIQRGLYGPGEKLPTEPEIMAEQGVSRTVVREAMSRLQAAGFVETRHGIGSFVLPAPHAAASIIEPPAALTIRDVVDMLELRIGVETEAAGLAALRRTEEHLALMRQSLHDFEEGINRGESSVDADFQIHLQIALATGNACFEDFYRRLDTSTIPRTRLEMSQLSTAPAKIYLSRVNREHTYIYDAIARKDPPSARTGMRVHLANSLERLRKAIKSTN
jgi:DNA-binding FadR family transcriptional regulator